MPSRSLQVHKFGLRVCNYFRKQHAQCIIMMQLLSETNLPGHGHKLVCDVQRSAFGVQRAVGNSPRRVIWQAQRECHAAMGAETEYLSQLFRQNQEEEATPDEQRLCHGSAVFRRLVFLLRWFLL
ncbi:hypothetical protein EW146_g7528 [Bondarzewia mesenterica]|uniref:Uncharacterized protein n=1 Tax=Bondarzewia mesenterica TaxID=1095465 RepID=A0A4S4LKP4_9AGAM|nr:hypothetical protein EW146_g7528 [Bondarzewia mesenterica]